MFEVDYLYGLIGQQLVHLYKQFKYTAQSNIYDINIRSFKNLS